jgi:hypothetical protein
MPSLKFTGRHAISAVLSLLLAACGGGGGGGGSAENPGGGGANPPPTSTSPVAGAWSGTAGAGVQSQVFVLADGTLWAFVGAVPATMFRGPLQASGGALSGSALRGIDYVGKLSFDANASGSYVPGSSMALTLTPAGASSGTQFALSAVSSGVYDPARAAALADVAGAWGGAFTAAETGVVSISNAGAITTVTSEGCSGAGTLTPRQNENVFDMVLTLGPAPCAAPNETATGAAFVVGTGTAARLYFGVVTTSGTQGATFVGGR